MRKFYRRGTSNHLGDQFALVRCHVRGGKNLLCWIDREEDEDLAVTGFGRIFRAERLDMVLIRFLERDASAGFGDHIADTYPAVHKGCH